jgi:hypothetical protein
MIVYSDAPAAAAEDCLCYHRRRAEEELRIAQSARCAVSRRFHYHLAALHLDRAFSEGSKAEAGIPTRRVA